MRRNRVVFRSLPLRQAPHASFFNTIVGKYGSMNRGAFNRLSLVHRLSAVSGRERKLNSAPVPLQIQFTLPQAAKSDALKSTPPDKTLQRDRLTEQIHHAKREAGERTPGPQRERIVTREKVIERERVTERKVIVVREVERIIREQQMLRREAISSPLKGVDASGSASSPQAQTAAERRAGVTPKSDPSLPSAQQIQRMERDKPEASVGGAVYTARDRRQQVSNTSTSNEPFAVTQMTRSNISESNKDNRLTPSSISMEHEHAEGRSKTETGTAALGRWTVWPLHIHKRSGWKSRQPQEGVGDHLAQPGQQPAQPDRKAKRDGPQPAQHDRKPEHSDLQSARHDLQLAQSEHRRSSGQLINQRAANAKVGSPSAITLINRTNRRTDHNAGQWRLVSPWQRSQPTVDQSSPPQEEWPGTAPDEAAKSHRIPTQMADDGVATDRAAAMHKTVHASGSTWPARTVFAAKPWLSRFPALQLRQLHADVFRHRTTDKQDDVDTQAVGQARMHKLLRTLNEGQQPIAARASLLHGAQRLQHTMRIALPTTLAQLTTSLESGIQSAMPQTPTVASRTSGAARREPRQTEATGFSEDQDSRSAATAKIFETQTSRVPTIHARNDASVADHRRDGVVTQRQASNSLTEKTAASAPGQDGQSSGRQGRTIATPGLDDTTTASNSASVNRQAGTFVNRQVSAPFDIPSGSSVSSPMTASASPYNGPNRTLIQAASSRWRQGEPNYPFRMSAHRQLARTGLGLSNTQPGSSLRLSSPLVFRRHGAGDSGSTTNDAATTSRGFVEWRPSGSEFTRTEVRSTGSVFIAGHPNLPPFTDQLTGTPTAPVSPASPLYTTRWQTAPTVWRNRQTIVQMQAVQRVTQSKAPYRVTQRDSAATASRMRKLEPSQLAQTLAHVNLTGQTRDDVEEPVRRTGAATFVAASSLSGQVGNVAAAAQGALTPSSLTQARLPIMRRGMRSLAAQHPITETTQSSAAGHDGGTIADLTFAAPPLQMREISPSSPPNLQHGIPSAAAMELRKPAVPPPAPTAAGLPVQTSQPIDMEQLQQAIGELQPFNPEQLAEQVYRALTKRLKFEQRLQGY